MTFKTNKSLIALLVGLLVSSAVLYAYADDLAAVENPKHNAVINPKHNAVINPKHNAVINPKHNAVINPKHNAVINPKHNAVINPKHNAVINPKHNAVINPKHNKRWAGGYNIFNLDGKHLGSAVVANKDVLVQFDSTSRWICYFVGNGEKGFNWFDTDSNWKGYLVHNSQSGFNLFDTGGEWLGFLATHKHNKPDAGDGK
jgi:hypothetical protein